MIDAILNTFSFFLNPIILGSAVIISTVIVLIEWIRLRVLPVQLSPDLAWLKIGVTSSLHGYTHKSGVSGYYLNSDYLTTSPYEVDRLSNWYVDAINKFREKEKIDAIVFIEKDSGPIGVITLTAKIVSETGIPSVIVRPKKRNPSVRITGSPDIIRKMSKGMHVIMITDTITTKRTVKDAVDVVNEFGGKVVGVCTILDREVGGTDFGRKIPVIAYATEEELIEGGLLKNENK